MGDGTLTPPVSGHDHVQGSADAPVTIVEFGDYQCPACGAAYPLTKELQAALSHRLRFAFRNFPLTQMHPYALAAAQTAEAAALQGKFWDMHDLLFERQDSLSPDILPVWSEEIGLDLAKLKTALEHEDILERIKKDRMSGIQSGVNGTPTFFINGYRYDGPLSYPAILSVIEDL